MNNRSASQGWRILATSLVWGAVLGGSGWFSGGELRAEPAANAWRPRYLCVCEPYCPKWLPCLPNWCASWTCDDYCRKPIPCVPATCLQLGCDDYQCKPLPPCSPCGPCPPRWNYLERLPPVVKKP